MKILEVKGLEKSYHLFKLTNVSFALESGRITGFIGRNGAGKTTVIKSILNLVNPERGEILYKGESIRESEAVFKMHTGYSSGALSWYKEKRILTIASVVKSFYDEWSDEEYRKYLSLFALDENKKPSELSGGMSIKCNLLFALSHSADILILDEPTSSLDPFSRDELLRLFKILKEEGKAVFFSTHIISDISKIADDILYISNGRIRFSGTKEDFLKDLCLPHESMEEAFLRLEKEESHV